jgi:hypothetical protein
VALALRAHSRGEWFTGADAPTMFDELQYFAWIRDASDHFLVANLFRIGPSRHVFADPIFLVSAGVHRLGASVPIAYLIWIPVAVAALALGPFAFARSYLRSGWSAAAAVALGAFYVGPIFLALHWTNALSAAHDATLAGSAAVLFPGVMLLGGLPFAIAIGLVPVAFVLVQRDRAWAAAAVAFVVAWIHPWQGEQIALACLAAFLLERRSFNLLAPVLAAAVPLAYFALLAHHDYDWNVAHTQARSTHVEAWAMLVALVPLLVFAARGVRDPRRAVEDGRLAARGEALLLAWPVACVVAFLVTPSVASHALIGISLPLAVLAVRGWIDLRWSRAAGALLTCAAAAAGVVYGAQSLRDSVTPGTQPYSISRSDHAALEFLAQTPIRGGVLARTYAGALVPAFTGRQTWVGHASWTPQFLQRALLAERLIRGAGTNTSTVGFVRATGARFVFADCQAQPGLAADLRPLVAKARRFGCATVFTLRGPAQPRVARRGRH